MTTKKLNSAAQEAIRRAMEATREATIELTEAQQEAVKEFKSMELVLITAKQKNDDARKAAHKAVDEEFNAFFKEMDKGRAELKENFKQKLIELGVKEPDLVLSETPVVKVLDKHAKGFLGGIGKARDYIKNGINGK